MLISQKFLFIKQNNWIYQYKEEHLFREPYHLSTNQTGFIWAKAPDFFAFRINHVQPVFDLNTRFWKLKADFQFDGNVAT